MPDNTTVNFFPISEKEAVAFLYVQHQDLTGKSPSEIYTMYQEAYYEILADKREKNQSGWFKSKRQELRQS